MRKLNICMITPKKYPVPAVNGGSVEGLAEMLINENEKQALARITVVSVQDEKAQEKSKGLQQGRILYIKRKKSDWISENRAACFLNRYFVRHYSRPFIRQQYVKRVVDAIKREIKRTGRKFDHYIVEDGDYGIYKCLSDFAGRENISIHLHGVTEGNMALCRWYSHFICVSNFVARKLTENGFVSPKMTDVLYNAVSLDRVMLPKEYDRALMRKKHGIRVDEFVFLFWGRIIPQKGVRELIKAYKLLHRKYPTARLVIAGAAEFALQSAPSGYEKEIADMCRDVPEIIFTGHIPNEKMKELAGIADAAVLPSVGDETAGLAMLEAACMGIPLITMPNGGVGEYVCEDAAVWISWTKYVADDLYQCMAKLMTDLEYRDSLTRHRDDYRKKFQSGVYYKNYIGLIETYAAMGRRMVGSGRDGSII